MCRCRSAGQVGFRKGFTTLDHILTLQDLIEESRAHNKRIYCCFVDFQKAFDTATCSAYATARSPWCSYRYAMGFSNGKSMRSMKSASGKVQSSKGFSEVVASTIGVKQGCPLLPTLFGLYIDDVSHYIERFGGSERTA